MGFPSCLLKYTTQYQLALKSLFSGLWFCLFSQMTIFSSPLRQQGNFRYLRLTSLHIPKLHVVPDFPQVFLVIWRLLLCVATGTFNRSIECGKILFQDYRHLLKQKFSHGAGRSSCYAIHLKTRGRFCKGTATSFARSKSPKETAYAVLPTAQLKQKPHMHSS